MLEELGVPYQLVESATPWSREVKEHHVTGKVPVLLVIEERNGTDGTNSTERDTEPLVLTESLAINTYLGDTYLNLCRDDRKTNHSTEQQGNRREAVAAAEEEENEGFCPPLTMPKFGSLERVRYEEVLSCILSEIDASLWCHRKHTDLGKFFGSIPDVTAPSEANFHRANKFLAARCRPYLLGRSFTPADIAYAHCLDWAVGEKWHLSTEWPANALERYLELCHARPAYRRARRIRAESRAPPHAAKL
jgi:glutathione S-transferase